MEQAIFLVSSAVCLLSAGFIVTRHNPIYSVVGMLPFFLGMTIIFVMLSAPFLAAMLMMVYGGAILIVFLFVIMLINVRPEELKLDASAPGYLLPAVLAGAVGALLLGFIFAGVPADGELERAFAQGVAASGPGFGSLGSLSRPLFRLAVVPFELVSLLIVVALLGVVLLGKKKL